jgi:hypothetical protein
MVATGRGVSASPSWMVERNAKDGSLVSVRLGKSRILKQIIFGIQDSDIDYIYISSFIESSQSGS